MSRTDQEILTAFLEQRQPQHILAVGAEALNLTSEWCAKNTESTLTTFPDARELNADAFAHPVDFALLAGQLNLLSADVVEPTIAGLRDRYSKHLMVQLDEEPRGNEDHDGQDQTRAENTLNTEDLRALGLRLVSGSRRLFQFNLDNYKHNPDWLNSRYWANPAQWNKRRW